MTERSVFLLPVRNASHQRELHGHLAAGETGTLRLKNNSKHRWDSSRTSHESSPLPSGFTSASLAFSISSSLQALAPAAQRKLERQRAASTSEESRMHHACALVPQTVCTGPAAPEAASKTSRKETAPSTEAVSSQHPPLLPQKLKTRINVSKPQHSEGATFQYSKSTLNVA